MNIRCMLGALTLIAASSSSALAEDEGTQNRQSSTALPRLPVFALPVQASDAARLHVSLAHARRDTRRAAHTRAASAHEKPAQRQLEAARERQAAAQTRRDAAQLRQADAQERRAEVAVQHQLNAEVRRAAAAERRATAAR